MLRDVGSLNGTYVNRERADEAILHHGDEVQIGRYRLSFVLGDEHGTHDVATVDHVSIGDVLDQLRPEFEDITISKIRFLESQGLIDPERTPSGYRKFSPSDVERLRFILREQREHFLPLKVIKERLDPRSTARSGSSEPPAAAAPTGQGEPKPAAGQAEEAPRQSACGRAPVRDDAPGGGVGCGADDDRVGRRRHHARRLRARWKPR